MKKIVFISYLMTFSISFLQAQNALMSGKIRM